MLVRKFFWDAHRKFLYEDLVGSFIEGPSLRILWNSLRRPGVRFWYEVLVSRYSVASCAGTSCCFCNYDNVQPDLLLFHSYSCLYLKHEFPTPHTLWGFLAGVTESRLASREPQHIKQHVAAAPMQFERDGLQTAIELDAQQQRKATLTEPPNAVCTQWRAKVQRITLARKHGETLETSVPSEAGPHLVSQTLRGRPSTSIFGGMCYPANYFAQVVKLWKRSCRVRLPSKSACCEVSFRSRLPSKTATWSCENEVFVRGFLRKLTSWQLFWALLRSSQLFPARLSSSHLSPPVLRSSSAAVLLLVAVITFCRDCLCIPGFQTSQRGCIASKLPSLIARATVTSITGIVITNRMITNATSTTTKIITSTITSLPHQHHQHQHEHQHYHTKPIMFTTTITTTSITTPPPPSPSY